MKTKTALAVSLLLLVALNLRANPPDTEQGKNIFITRCAACHSVNKILTGPALAGVDERRSMDWIISFVQSSQSMIKSGDPDAVAIFEKFNKVPMPDNADLTPDNIKSIVSYIQSQSQTGITEKKTLEKNFKKKVNYLPLSFKNNYAFFIGYFAVVLMLVLALLFAVQSNSFQRRMRGENLSA